MSALQLCRAVKYFTFLYGVVLMYLELVGVGHCSNSTISVLLLIIYVGKHYC